MGAFDWVTFEEGRARFAGFEGGREGKLRFVFAVELPNGRPFLENLPLCLKVTGTTLASK